MIIQVAEVTPYGSPILVAIVESIFTQPAYGPDMVKRIQAHYPLYPIMLVSVEENGFRAHASFQTHLLLALIQLEHLQLVELDLDQPPVEQPLPF